MQRRHCLCATAVRLPPLPKEPRRKSVAPPLPEPQWLRPSRRIAISEDRSGSRTATRPCRTPSQPPAHKAPKPVNRPFASPACHTTFARFPSRARNDCSTDRKRIPQEPYQAAWPSEGARSCACSPIDDLYLWTIATSRWSLSTICQATWQSGRPSSNPLGCPRCGAVLPPQNRLRHRRPRRGAGRLPPDMQRNLVGLPCGDPNGRWYWPGPRQRGNPRDRQPIGRETRPLGWKQRALLRRDETSINRNTRKSCPLK